MLDAEQVMEPRGLIPEGCTAAEANVLRFYDGSENPTLAVAADTADVDPLIVWGNHGRWVVECPTGDGGAQFASRQDNRFMCIECLNVAVGGLWIPVVWPDDVADLEAVLDARPVEENRNWVAGQTVDDLLAEDQSPQDQDEEDPIDDPVDEPNDGQEVTP